MKFTCDNSQRMKGEPDSHDKNKLKDELASPSKHARKKKHRESVDVSSDSENQKMEEVKPSKKDAKKANLSFSGFNEKVS